MMLVKRNEHRVASRLPRLVMLAIGFLLIHVTPVSGEELLPFQDAFTGEYGYMDGDGDVVIEPRFRRAYEFHQGAAIVEEDLPHDFRYIDIDGEPLHIPRIPERAFPQPFSEGLALVETDEGAYYIDRTGDIVSPMFAAGESFSEGIAIVWKDGGVYAIDTSFESLFEIRVDPYDTGEYFGRFSSGRMPIKDINGNWGYIDDEGNIAIRPQYEVVSEFDGDYAYANVGNDEWVVLDRTGEVVYEFSVSQGHMERRVFLSGDTLILYPDQGEIRLYVLPTGEESVVQVPAAEHPGPSHLHSPPVLLDQYVFYQGAFLDLSGRIVNEIDDFMRTEDVFYDYYVLVSVDYDTQKFIALDGRVMDRTIYH